MRRRASREDDLSIDFIKRRAVIFCFFLSRLGCLNCINCTPVPHRTGNHPHEALWRKRPHFGWLGVQLHLGDRAKRCLSEDPAPAAYSAVPKISWNVGWRNRGSFYHHHGNPSSFMFARWNPRLKPSPNSNRLCWRCRRLFPSICRDVRIWLTSRKCPDKKTALTVVWVRRTGIVSRERLTAG